MERSEVQPEGLWNVEALYPSAEEWNKDFNSCSKDKTWEELQAFRGRLEESAATVLKATKLYLDLEQRVGKIYIYASLRRDEDLGDSERTDRFQRAASLEHRLSQETAFLAPELLELSEEKLRQLLQDPSLAPYKFYLEKIVRLKKHTLGSAEEKLLAAAALPLDAASRAFGSFNNADLHFPDTIDAVGKPHPLTHGTYQTYMESHDRTLRKNSFQTMLTSYAAWENTLAELIHGEMQKHLFFAKARNFSSCLDAALFPHAIDPAVYRQLIATTRKNLPTLHAYFALRKKIMKLDELHLYDLRVPLIQHAWPFDFDAAAHLTLDAVAPLGKPYQETLRQGLLANRWVDRYETPRKRSGAYSSGRYGTFPYILLNYQGRFSDMKTLAHEAGHSMHSYLSWKTQAYHDASYPIFLAEVASTFHEELVQRLLLERAKTREEKIFLLTQKIEDIRNTFVRQVMFAEFELAMHTAVENSIPLTHAYLKSTYLELNRDYFGSPITLDPEIAMEWARIPHFYYNFYVYQYATGIAAAHALVDTVLANGPEAYLRFLSSGGSKFPLDTLKLAGVDMTTSAPIEATFKQLGLLTSELEKLLH